MSLKKRGTSETDQYLRDLLTSGFDATFVNTNGKGESSQSKVPRYITKISENCTNYELIVIRQLLYSFYSGD